MSNLYSEIIPDFTDPRNGLVSPGYKQETNNGVMYTGELAMIMLLRGELTYRNALDIANLVAPCFVEAGLIGRNPKNDQGLTSPDDLMGLAALCYALRRTFMGRDTWTGQILSYGLRNFGCYNNVNPGKWTFESFFWRQPQLIAAFVAAKGDIPFFLRPLLWFAAVSIFYSCRDTDVSDTDARRLSWLLIQIVAGESWLCRMASKGWYERLRRDYGPEGMKTVAKIYYGAGHPFIEGWVN